jgi:hypothetical protein
MAIALEAKRAGRLLDGTGDQDRAVMCDAKKVTAGLNKRYIPEVAEVLRNSDLPICPLWAPGGNYFPISFANP